jgi:hypothetical protein
VLKIELVPVITRHSVWASMTYDVGLP